MSRRRHRLGYETKRQPLVSPSRFAARVGRSIATSGILISLSLFGGMLGYQHYENMEWIDAFANAAMILSGMGPLASPQTWNGKLFAGLYALYSGLALVAASGLILAPILHRIFHRFHLESGDES